MTLKDQQVSRDSDVEESGNREANEKQSFSK